MFVILVFTKENVLQLQIRVKQEKEDSDGESLFENYNKGNGRVLEGERESEIKRDR